MIIVEEKPVPIYESTCPECKSVFRYKAAEVTYMHVKCPVCGISVWASNLFELDEIDFCLSDAISPQEAKERYEAHKKRYDEWFAWKQTAPSDDLLCYLGSEKRQTVAWYSHTYNEWTTVDEKTVYQYGEVTHWMPLPEPPKEET